MFLLNRRRNIFVLSLIGLSVFGLLTTLIFEPGQLLKQIAIYAFFGVVIFLIYKWFVRRRIGGKEHSAYLRAAKQSAKRFNEGSKKSNVLGTINKKTSFTSIKKSNQSSTPKKKTTPTHLTVIEGKKGKKKNRAFF